MVRITTWTCLETAWWIGETMDGPLETKQKNIQCIVMALGDVTAHRTTDTESVNRLKCYSNNQFNKIISVYRQYLCLIKPWPLSTLVESLVDIAVKATDIRGERLVPPVKRVHQTHRVSPDKHMSQTVSNSADTCRKVYLPALQTIRAAKLFHNVLV